MKYYKIHLQQLSSTLTPLRADTLFGHLCWQIALREGEEGIKSFLENFDKNHPFLFSDAFPDGFLPKPLTDKDYPDLEGKKSDKIKILQIWKKFKKVKYISVETFQKYFQGGKKFDKMEDWKAEYWEACIADKEKLEDKIKTEVIQKNVIDRSTFQALEGGLFDQKETFVSKNFVWNIYIGVDENQEEWNIKKIIEYLEYVFEIGYGAKKSTGKGVFTILDISQIQRNEDASVHEITPKKEEVEENKYEAMTNLFTQDSDKKMLLSSCILTKDEMGILENSQYSLQTKYGKLGENFSHNENPFKKPVRLLEKGSVLETKENFMGKLYKTATDEKIQEYGFGLLVPMTLDFSKKN